MKPTAYKLENCATGCQFEESGWILSDPNHNEPALIRAIYEKRQIEFNDDSWGIYKFADWMPVSRVLEGSCAPITYKSEALAAELGLENLYITFSGWWPQRGATMPTCSFKETEAYSVCARLPEGLNRTLVVASAGNTARAFAHVCSQNNIPVVIAIPQDNLDALWFREPLNPCVKIICTPTGTDYYDTIVLASKLNGNPRYIEEGGAKNIARRDGMGTTVLSAAQAIGRIPDSYFQAVGSGTGAIAAYEANLRLLKDGRFGNHIMKLFPSQNIPFTPLYDAYKAGSRALLPSDEEQARKKALAITAKVLSNRRPPYSIAGGLFDVLNASNGEMLVATNDELSQACDMFEQLEGIDIHPAAGVAVASLIGALEKKKIRKDETVMLNITGGGEKSYKNNHEWYSVEPNLIMDASTPAEEVIAAVDQL